MSFYLRTSIGVGPVRVGMSRSGLGASVGVPGFRLGAGPRGTYISLGGGLVSYRATVRSPRGSSAVQTTPVAHPTQRRGEVHAVLALVSGAHHRTDVPVTSAVPRRGTSHAVGVLEGPDPADGRGVLRRARSGGGTAFSAAC